MRRRRSDGCVDSGGTEGSHLTSPRSWCRSAGGLRRWCTASCIASSLVAQASDDGHQLSVRHRRRTVSDADGRWSTFDARRRSRLAPSSCTVDGICSNSRCAGRTINSRVATASRVVLTMFTAQRWIRFVCYYCSTTRCGACTLLDHNVNRCYWANFIAIQTCW